MNVKRLSIVLIVLAVAALLLAPAAQAYGSLVEKAAGVKAPGAGNRTPSPHVKKIMNATPTKISRPMMMQSGLIPVKATARPGPGRNETKNVPLFPALKSPVPSMNYSNLSPTPMMMKPTVIRR